MHDAGSRKQAHIPFKKTVKGDLPPFFRQDVSPELSISDEEQTGAVKSTVMKDSAFFYLTVKQAGSDPFLLALVKFWPQGKIVLKILGISFDLYNLSIICRAADVNL